MCLEYLLFNDLKLCSFLCIFSSQVVGNTEELLALNERGLELHQYRLSNLTTSNSGFGEANLVKGEKTVFEGSGSIDAFEGSGSEFRESDSKTDSSSEILNSFSFELPEDENRWQYTLPGGKDVMYDLIDSGRPSIPATTTTTSTTSTTTARTTRPLPTRRIPRPTAGQTTQPTTQPTPRPTTQRTTRQTTPEPTMRSSTMAAAMFGENFQFLAAANAIEAGTAMLPTDRPLETERVTTRSITRRIPRPTGRQTTQPTTQPTTRKTTRPTIRRPKPTPRQTTFEPTMRSSTMTTAMFGDEFQFLAGANAMEAGTDMERYGSGDSLEFSRGRKQKQKRKQKGLDEITDKSEYDYKYEYDYNSKTFYGRDLYPSNEYGSQDYGQVSYYDHVHAASRVDGFSCWTCTRNYWDENSSGDLYADCRNFGEPVLCSPHTEDTGSSHYSAPVSCQVTERRFFGIVTELHVGCKQTHACQNNFIQNRMQGRCVSIQSTVVEQHILV